MSPFVGRYGSGIEVGSEGEQGGTFAMVLPTKEVIVQRV